MQFLLNDFEAFMMIALRELDTGNYIHPKEFEIITQRKIPLAKIVKKDHLKKKFVEGGVSKVLQVEDGLVQG